MTLAEPAFLLLLILIPFLALGAWLAQRQRKTAWQKLVSPRLQKRLVGPSSPLSRWLSLSAGLLALSLLIIALAQPIAGEEQSTSLIKGRNIIIAIDVSRSMLARDVAPDRMTSAKAAIYELLEKFPNDRIGILAFAGSAFLQAPLTIDHHALRETLNQLDTNNVPSGGSNLADAVNLAIKSFKETGQSTHGLIVLSDGELHEGELAKASADARQEGVFVVTIGVGTEEGAFIPDNQQTDGNFRDREGKAVLTRLKPAPLRSLAADTGGIYLEGATHGFDEQINTVIERLDAFEDEGRVHVTPIPRFQWFLIPSVICMIASLLLRSFWSPSKPLGIPTNPSTLLITLILISSSATESQAWDNPLEGFLGSKKLKQEKHSEALSHFSKAAESATGEELAAIEYAKGTTHYQEKNYQAAANAYAKALLGENKQLNRDTHFQLANTLFHRGVEASPETQKDLNPSALLEDALNHYDSALQIDPNHEASIKNREVTAKVLEQMKEQEQQQEQSQEGDQKEDEKGEQSKDSEKSEGEGEGESENQEQQQQEESDPQDEDQSQQGENGEDQENQQGQGEEGEEQDEKNTSQQQQSEGEEDNQQSDRQSQQAHQAQPQSPREDETPEEFARRILQENADFQQQALRRKGRQTKPTKDW